MARHRPETDGWPIWPAPLRMRRRERGSFAGPMNDHEYSFDINDREYPFWTITNITSIFDVDAAAAS